MRAGVVIIPDVPGDISKSHKLLLQRMKEALEVLQGAHASAPEERRAVTFKDLEDLGLSSGSADTEALEWTDITTFYNSWVNFGSPWFNAGYSKSSSNIVRLRGVIKLGAWNTRAFALPTGYRPTSRMRFPTIGYNYAAAGVDVQEDGDVYIRSTSASHDWLSLDGINYHVG